MGLHFISPYIDFFVVLHDRIVERHYPLKVLLFQCIAKRTWGVVFVVIKIFLHRFDQAISDVVVEVLVGDHNGVRITSAGHRVFGANAACPRSDLVRTEVGRNRRHTLPACFVVRIQHWPANAARAAGKLLGWRCHCGGKGGVHIASDNAVK